VAAVAAVAAEVVPTAPSEILSLNPVWSRLSPLNHRPRPLSLLVPIGVRILN